MEMVKKRLKGLCALITAAAVSLSALAVPAMAAEGITESAMKLCFTTTKKAVGEAYSVTINAGNTSKKLESFFRDAATVLDDFHEFDTSNYSVAGIEGSTGEVIGYLEDNKIKPLKGNEDAEIGEMLHYDNEIRYLFLRKGIEFDYSNDFALFVLTQKAKSFTLPVYDDDGNKVFEFTTDCESKYFPIDELKQNFSCALNIEYKHDAVNIVSAGCTSGDKLWQNLTRASSEEELNSNKFDPQYLKLTINYPNYTLTKIDLSYSEGYQKGYTQENPDFYEIVTRKNDYFNSRLTDNDFWAVKTGGYNGDGPRQEKVETIKGSDLISALITKSTTLNSITGTLTHMGKIAVCNTISGDPDPASSDYSDFYYNYNFKFSNMTEYTIDHLPVTAYELAREAGIKPAGAVYDAALYTPSSWTVWGGGFNYTSGYVATTTKVNGKFESKDGFDFNNHGGIDLFNLPILQVHEMKLLEVDIPCDEVTGGKLTYTAADHTDFPTKAGVTSWKFTYDGASVNVKNANELWRQIEKIIVTDGKVYDSSLAKLTVGATKWDNAFDDKTPGPDGTVTIKVPDGDNKIPKDIIEKIKDGGKITIIEYPDGTKWEIDPDSIDLSKVPSDGIDLSITKKTTNMATVINKVTGVQYKMQISIAYTGEFGFTATLIIDLSEGMVGAPDGDYYATLFQVMSDDGMEWRTYGKLDKNNVARLKFTHASDWAIIIDSDIMGGTILSGAEITVEAPVKGEAASAPSAGASSATVDSHEWSPNLVNGKFEANTEYTLTVKLKPTADIDAVSRNMTVTVNGDPAAVTLDDNSQLITVTYKFPKTSGDTSGGSTSSGSHYSGGKSDVKESAKTDSSTGWSQIANEMNNAGSGSTIKIRLNDEPVIPKEALEAAKKNKLILEIDAEGRHMTLDGSKLSTDKDLDLSVSGTNSGIPESAYSDKSFDSVQTITIGAAGTDINAVMKIFAGTGKAGGTADVYYWNNGKLDYVGRYTVGGNGWVSFDAAKGGSYLVGVNENKDGNSGSITYGDADGNGKLELADALVALRYSVGEKITCDTTAADVNGDGKVTVADALLILRKCVDLIAKFPVEG